MWQTKTFKTRSAMERWLGKREGRIQFEEIAVNNGYGVTWRPLRFIGG